MAEEVMFLTGLKNTSWPVGEPGSLGWISMSHFNTELARPGLPFPWADPAHKHWPKPKYHLLPRTTLLLVGLQEEYSLEKSLVPEIWCWPDDLIFLWEWIKVFWVIS